MNTPLNSKRQRQLRAKEPSQPQQVNDTGIPTPVLRTMEEVLQHDLSKVRLHPNSGAAQAVEAQAFAQGSDVHVAPGYFNPQTSEGKRLLGHELTHVVQQAQGRVRASGILNGVPVNDDPGLEQEADRMGARASQASGSGPSAAQLKAVPVGPGANGVAQRVGVPFAQIQSFLRKNRDARFTKLDQMTPEQLARLSNQILSHRADWKSDLAGPIEETLADIRELMEPKQGSDVERLGKSANWANLTVTVDGVVVATVASTKSGLVSGGKRSKWGFAAKKTSKKKEVEISHRDSEATVFNTVEAKLSGEKLSGAKKSIGLVFISTNGACNGCKGRINEFVRTMILPKAGQGVGVTMRYKYSKQPKDTERGDVPTKYGWDGDTQVGSFYQHTTVYRSPA